MKLPDSMARYEQGNGMDLTERLREAAEHATDGWALKEDAEAIAEAVIVLNAADGLLRRMVEGGLEWRNLFLAGPEPDSETEQK
jgi:hypothetical protein